MRIVVAMSGGVDSSVAAALLAEQGHDVIGLSMQLYDQTEGQTSFGSCCSLDDLHDARRVAAAIDIPHYILNFERQFDEQVVSNFVQRVRRRPHAAALRALQQRSEVRDAGRARARLRRRRASPPATTRASSATRRPAAIVLKRGVDPAKDQSYFLFSLTQEQLARARLPGRRSCRRTRSASTRGSAGLPVADKPDSQEICFIPDNDYAAFVTQARAGRRARRARSSTSSGRVLGTPRRHPPLHGRPAQGPRPRVVADGRADVRAGAPAGRSAGRRRPEGVARADDADRVGRELDCRGAGRTRCASTAQIRHRHQAAPATRRDRSGDGRAEVVFDAPQLAITPGQAVVFYDGDVVVGGGWID